MSDRGKKDVASEFKNLEENEILKDYRFFIFKVRDNNTLILSSLKKYFC